jgi:AAA family ATP:ADP antiporter
MRAMPPAGPGSVSEPRTLVSHPELKSQQSFPFFKTIGEPPKGPLDRALSIFADVRAGEGVGALILAANIFVILASYYLLRSARQGLILTEGAPFGWRPEELASYTSAAMALVLLGLVPLYGWLGSRVPRMTLITITTLFFASNLLVFYVLGRAGFREGIAFYIWVGVFNLFLPAQFWGFANDLYTEGQGRRLFPLIGVGASVGAVVGAFAVGTLVRYFEFTPFSLMGLAAPVLIVALALTFVANGRETRRADPAAARANVEPLGKEGGFELVVKDRYLTWIAVLIVLLNIVNSVGGFLLNRLVVDRAAAISDPAERTAFVTLFSADYDATIAILSALLQLFATSRALR